MPRLRARSRYFATVLKEIIDRIFDGNITEFGRKVGINSSSASYYTRAGSGGRFPSPDQLDRLIRALPVKERSSVVVAYLQDMIPPSAASIVRVEAAGALPAVQPVKSEVRLPEKTEEAFEFLRSLCVDNSDIRRMIEITARAMRGDR